MAIDWSLAAKERRALRFLTGYWVLSLRGLKIFLHHTLRAASTSGQRAYRCIDRHGIVCGRIATVCSMSVTVLSSPVDVRSDDRERVLSKVKALVADWLHQLIGGDLPTFEVQ